MTADGEVAPDPGHAQLPCYLAELGQKELEDKREANHYRLARRKSLGDAPAI